MSKYTTLLRWIVEQELDDKGLCYKEENWKYVYDKIGLADYPIFNEEYREELNNKIIRHYYFREIGMETANLFRWHMRREMFEIMPYYNQLYESEILAKDMQPLLSFKEYKNRDRTLDHTSNIELDQDTTNHLVFDGEVNNEHEDTNAGESTTDSTNQNIFSDTPMNMLHDDDELNPIQSSKWATTVTYDAAHSYETHEDTTDGTYKTETDNVTDSTGTLDSTTDTVANDIENEKFDYYGFRESQARLLKEYRETFLNIDLDIVNDLRDLFMGLW